MKTRWMMMAGLMALSGMAQAAFVTIGNAGNAADTTGYGRVDYTYQISATEVTIAEFAASGAGSGNQNYWNDGVRSVGTAAPAVNVSLYEAMKYCNWLTSGDINLGAYVFSGGVYQSTDRASAISTYRTVYAMPTEDEWYKAAYFRLDASGYSLYANGTGPAPVAGTDANYTDYFKWVAEQPWVVETGTAEQNGTYDMMGNVWEWMEDPVLRSGTFFVNDYRRPRADAAESHLFSKAFENLFFQRLEAFVSNFCRVVSFSDTKKHFRNSSGPNIGKSSFMPSSLGSRPSAFYRRLF